MHALHSAVPNAGASAPEGLLNLHGARLLIFVVAYDAERTLQSVLDRIPASLHQEGVEVLVIDDCSKDRTFDIGRSTRSKGLRISTLRNPVNQRYGGNQKLGYRYAIDHGFDVVALLHGDGQYAPGKLPDLLGPILAGEADAVLGSRMLHRGAARRGGMPPYKYVGNRILSAFQNWILGTRLSEFHSGYRAYTVDALRQIPFERNTNEFHFDTEIINQLVFRKLRLVEVPIPTYYGDELCHVDGLRYAWDVCKTMLLARLHQLNLLYDRKFDVDANDEHYDLKIGYVSSHTLALAAVNPDGTLLDLGCGQGLWSELAALKGARVTAVDQFAPIGKPSSNARVRYIRWNLDSARFPAVVSRFDQIFLLDIVEHLRDPEAFLDQLRQAAGGKRPDVILTTANIGFFVTRLMLLLGRFNYGRKGILDRTHTRLFTFGTLQKLLEQAGYLVEEIRGIPAPYPSAIGLNRWSRVLLWINCELIRLCHGLFSYQIYVRARAVPTVHQLLAETIEASGLRSEQVRN
ncbi:MAG: bifunctional glycosyltransferase/class I SAM-dependent methyltransferase [Chthoniobacterales bacterium]